MKKLIVMFMAVLATVGVSLADSYTWSSDTLSTAAQFEVSSDLPIAGKLDRIIVWNSASACTTVVTVANYAGSTAADVIYSNSVANATPVTARPRRVGTTSAGVALAAVVGSGSDALTNLATTVLSAPYEGIMLGGNTKVRVLLQDAAATRTNTTSVQFIYSK